MMSRYRKVSTRIWNDERFRNLTDDAKLIFLFILTHPHMTSLGAMRATLNGMAEELGWTGKRLSEGFAELSRKTLTSFDAMACCLVIPKFIKHNPPENPNVIRSWPSQLELIPECDMKANLIDSLAEFTETLSEPFRKAFESLREGFAKPSRIPEPEPEPELVSSNEDTCDEAKPHRQQAPKSSVYFPIRGNSQWHLPQSKLDWYLVEFSGMFTDQELLAEFRKAFRWLTDNPARRKSAGGMPAFLTRWLNRAADSVKTTSAQTPDEEELPYIDLPRTPKPRRNPGDAAGGPNGRAAGVPSPARGDSGTCETN